MEPHAILNEVWSTSKDTVSGFIVRFTELVILKFYLENRWGQRGVFLAVVQAYDDQIRFYF